MKKLFAITLLIACISCSKKTPDGGNDPVVLPAGFIINGVKDVTVKKDSTHSYELEVKHESGTQEPVTLSVSGLPSSVTAQFTPEKGTPTFTSTIKFTAAKTADTGSYSVKITGTSNSGKAKSYDLMLRVTPENDCATELVGSYNVNQQCSGAGSANYSCTIETDPNMGKRIVLKDFFGQGDKFYADLNCETKAITLPTQSNQNGAVTIAGNGSFVSNNIVLSFTISPVNSTCVATFTKK